MLGFVFADELLKQPTDSEVVENIKNTEHNLPVTGDPTQAVTHDMDNCPTKDTIMNSDGQKQAGDCVSTSSDSKTKDSILLATPTELMCNGLESQMINGDDDDSFSLCSPVAMDDVNFSAAPSPGDSSSNGMVLGGETPATSQDGEEPGERMEQDGDSKSECSSAGM